MTSVYLTVPNGDGWIHKHIHFAVCRTLADRRYRIRHDAPTHRPYENNLAHCMNDFLAGGEDFWLSMDDDNPPQRNPLDLVELDLDIVGFPTPVWHSEVRGDRPWYFNALDAVGNDGWKPHPASSGLHEVDAIGSGCFLVARRVLLKLQHDQPFMRQWNSDGTVEVGCYFSFCRKAKAAGFKIWAAFDYICDHFNELPLLETINSFAALQPT